MIYPCEKDFYFMTRQSALVMLVHQPINFKFLGPPILLSSWRTNLFMNILDVIRILLDSCRPCGFYFVCIFQAILSQKKWDFGICLGIAKPRAPQSFPIHLHHFQSCSVSKETTDVKVTRGMLWSEKYIIMSLLFVSWWKLG